MNLNRLVRGYTARVLTEADTGQALALCQGNPLFYKHCPPPPSRESILADMQALPPGRTYEDKFYFGIFDADALIAIVDLILNYPNEETAFIGFFMVHAGCQGKGLGTLLVSGIVRGLAEMGYRYAYLGYAKGNAQSQAFWHKNHFIETGSETKAENYTIVKMARNLKLFP